MLRLGTAGARRFELHLGTATQASAVLGVRGKGKTNTAVCFVEEVLDQGVQVVVIDPTDVWWGLKSSRDGKRGGYPTVILGGAHGDLPIAEGAGAAVADFAVENRVPMILSLRHLRKGAAQRFVQDFAEQLYHRKGEPEHRRPLLLVIDEASRFIPQRVGPDQARLVGAIEDIVRQGRSSGFGVVLIDQRPASVNKDVLTQIELLVAHAVTSPQDRKALDEWIQGKDSAGHRGEFLKDLASLERGEAWFWSPVEDLFARVHVRQRRTFDSSRTPEVGEDPVAPERFAQVDLAPLRSALDSALEEALANDPKTLKRRIRELEGELAAAGRAGVDEAEVERRVRAAVERERTAMAERVEAAIVALRAHTRPVTEVLPRAESQPGTPPRRARHVAPAAPRPPAVATDPALGGPHRKILGALAWLEMIGVNPADSVAVAFIAGYSPTSSSFANPKGALRTHGLIEYPSAGTIALTDAGRALAEAPETPPTRSALHAMVLAKLAGPQQRILRPLLEAYPHPISNSNLAEEAGYSPTSLFAPCGGATQPWRVVK